MYDRTTKQSDEVVAIQTARKVGAEWKGGLELQGTEPGEVLFCVNPVTVIR